MKSYSICRAWAPVFFPILRSQGIHNSTEIPSGSYCYVDHPLKVKGSGATSRICAHLRTTGHQETSYAVEAWITDSSGREKLSEAMFVVPTREPSSAIEDFRGEWNDSLNVFLVCYTEAEATSDATTIEPVDSGNESGTDSVQPTLDEDCEDEELSSLDAHVVPDVGISSSLPEPAMAKVLDDLLKPEKFDWADDMDDLPVEAGASSVAEVQEDRGSIRVRIPNGPLIVDSSRATSPTYVPEPELAEPEEQGLAWTEPDAGDGSDYEPKDAVDFEFDFRNERIDNEDNEYNAGEWNVHHFNWYGQPVYEYSHTPAVISLLYIVSEPKAPSPSDEMRVHSILYRATRFVDPVVYFGQDWEDLERRGQDLVRAATGKVFKCYTLHGLWMSDARQVEEGTRVDHGVKDAYGSTEFVIANGFSAHPAVMNRWEREEARQALVESKRGGYSSRYTLTGRQGRVYAPSPLRSRVNVDDEWSEDEGEANYAAAGESNPNTIEEEFEDTIQFSPQTKAQLEEYINGPEKELIFDSPVSHRVEELAQQEEGLRPPYTEEENTLGYEGPTSDSVSDTETASQSMRSTTPEQLVASATESQSGRTTRNVSVSTTCSLPIGVPSVPDPMTEKPDNEITAEHKPDEEVADIEVRPTDHDIAVVNHDEVALGKNVDNSQGSFDDIGYPYSHVDESSDSNPSQYGDGSDEVDEHLMVPPLRIAHSNHHCSPEVDEKATVATAEQNFGQLGKFDDAAAQEGECADVSEAAPQVDSHGIVDEWDITDAYDVSSSTISGRRNSIDTLLQPEEPRQSRLRHRHSFPNLLSEFSNIVRLPFVVEQQADANHNGGYDREVTPGEVPVLNVPRKRGPCSGDIHATDTGERETSLDETISDVVPETENQSMVLTQSGNVAAENTDEQIPEEKHSQFPSTGKRFSRRVSGILGIKPSTVSSVPKSSETKPRRKLQKPKPKPKPKSMTNFFLEGISIIGQYPPEMII